MGQRNMLGKYKYALHWCEFFPIGCYVHYFRSNLSSITTMNDDRALKFTDSYLTSTMSTTSGLGSNYTTNTSGSGTQPPTPSPRRKTSATSFGEIVEMQEQEGNYNRGQIYETANYGDYRHSSQHYGTEDNLPMEQRSAYFGKHFLISHQSY